jgi:tetratricopeptide (TPR) repeat protein
MIRAVVLAVTLGAAAAGAIVYWFGQSAPYDWLAAWRGPPAATAEADAWPICSTMASVGEADGWASLDSDFAAGKQALGAGNWTAAIAALKLAALRDPQNADIQNYIGYAYRRLRQLEPAFAHFRQAIAFNPRHRAAHQHLGESYLAIGNLTAANEQLSALERICLIACAEHGDLQRAIAAFPGAGGS